MGGTTESTDGPSDRGRPDLLEKFLDDPEHAAVLGYAALFLRCTVRDPLALLGERVGVTVFPGGSDVVLLRVNTGWQLATDVRRIDGDLVVRAYLVSHDEGKDLEDVRALISGELADGLGRAADNRAVLFTGLERALALLTDPVAVERCRGYVETATQQRLSQPNLHNAALTPQLERLLTIPGP